MVANASSVPYRDQGMFKSWGKDTLSDQDESEQLKLWRDKCAKAKKRVSTPTCNSPHKTSTSARKCTARVPGANWIGYKPERMRTSTKNLIWRTGYPSTPSQAEEVPLPVDVPATSIPSLVKDLARVSRKGRSRSHSQSSTLSSDTSPALMEAQPLRGRSRSHSQSSTLSSDTSPALMEAQPLRGPQVHVNRYMAGKEASNVVQMHEPPQPSSNRPTKRKCSWSWGFLIFLQLQGWEMPSNQN